MQQKEASLYLASRGGASPLLHTCCRKLSELRCTKSVISRICTLYRNDSYRCVVVGLIVRVQIDARDSLKLSLLIADLLGRSNTVNVHHDGWVWSIRVCRGKQGGLKQEKRRERTAKLTNPPHGKSASFIYASSLPIAPNATNNAPRLHVLPPPASPRVTSRRQLPQAPASYPTTPPASHSSRQYASRRTLLRRVIASPGCSACIWTCVFASLSPVRVSRSRF